MDKDQTFALLFKGHEAWNEWATERLSERERIETRGDSLAQ